MVILIMQTVSRVEHDAIRTTSVIQYHRDPARGFADLDAPKSKTAPSGRGLVSFGW
ncbi:hypothetical protein [Aliiroseovarius marinus]|uniref:hypothetical protein n=1 Tax=Aliiroseovarius marinus TaxID=2500159 RepID=UPI0014151AD3|nr:hypothetical protein [Aliiroseovarius marinus]